MSMPRLQDLRLDRLVIRLLVSIGLLLGVLSATGVTGDAHPGWWRSGLGAGAALVALVAFVAGGAWWTSDPDGEFGEGRWTTAQLWTMGLGAAVLLVALPSSGITWFAFVPIATVARSRDARSATALLLAPVAALGYACLHQHSPWPTLAINLGFAAVAIVLLQQRRRQLEAAEFAAAQAQVISQERARTATAEQQREIAAQLHDVLAHTLSGLIIALQTAGLEARREQASPELQQRLSAATELAKEGLRGAREAVESLHGAAAATAQPLDEWLQGTVDRIRAASGVRITVAGEARAIPAQRDEVARAVLREALTNSMRHAPGLPVRITLAESQIRVLTVGDVSAAPRTDQVSGGHGLAGLRRRVETRGGRFEAGATADGWLVVARWEAV